DGAFGKQLVDGVDPLGHGQRGWVECAGTTTLTCADIAAATVFAVVQIPQCTVAPGIVAAKAAAEPLFGIAAEHQAPADQTFAWVHVWPPRSPYFFNVSNNRPSKASARAAVSVLTVNAASSGSCCNPSASRSVRAK